MANSSRDQVLTDFMDCTGLENVEECIQILTQNNWDLMIAIKMFTDKINGRDETNNQATVPKYVKTTSVSPPISRSNKSNAAGKRLTTVDRHGSNDVDQAGNDDITFLKSVPSPTKIAKTSTNAPSRVAGRFRELIFTIEYKDQTESIKMYDMDTVGLLKRKIYERLHVPTAQQRFTKFVSTHYDDQTLLKDLHLQRETTIHMIASTSNLLNGSNRVSPSSSSSGASASRPTRTSTSTSHNTRTANNHDNFPITVRFHKDSGSFVSYELLLSSTSTIKEMKQEVERVCSLPISHQLWKLPVGVNDTDQLKNTALKPKVTLNLSRAPGSPSKTSSSSTRKPNTITPTRNHSDDDKMEVDSPTNNAHFSDDDVIDISPNNHRTTTSAVLSDTHELLIPVNCTNDVVGLENFARVFQLRYGTTVPILYIGGLDAAIQESFHTSTSEPRPLAIYLHHDRSICANVFCTRVLATDTMVEYLANNYVVWAWDFTSDTNVTRFMESFRRAVGPQYAQAIFKMEKDAFPLILVLMRVRNSIEITSIIEGKSTTQEVLEILMKCHETFHEQHQRDQEEDKARKNREHLKKQQEDEYNQSLQADLAKEQARLADERKQEAEKLASERLEKKRLEEKRVSCARLPTEPSETEKNLTKFKIRLPDDQGILMRRFRVTETLQTLFDYLSSEGQFFGEYKLFTTYPKRDLTTFKCTDTFEALKLFPQEQLILESL